MKRTFAILLTLMMLFSVTAYAESTGTQAASIQQITFDETSAPYEGGWLTFDDDGFMLYIPSDWVDVDVTDEMLDAGTYYAASSADGAWGMTVSYSQDAGATSNDDLAAQLTDAGYENVTQLNVNGIDIVGYDITEQNVSGVAFLDSEGALYVISFTPADDEAFAVIGQTIIMSLSPME